MKVAFNKPETVKQAVKELYFARKYTVLDILEEFEGRLKKKEIERYIQEIFEDFQRGTKDEQKLRDRVVIEFIETDNKIIKVMLDSIENYNDPYLKTRVYEVVHNAQMDRIDQLQKVGILKKTPDKIEISKITEEVEEIAEAAQLAKKLKKEAGE